MGPQYQDLPSNYRSALVITTRIRNVAANGGNGPGKNLCEWTLIYQGYRILCKEQNFSWHKSYIMQYAMHSHHHLLCQSDTQKTNV